MKTSRHNLVSLKILFPTKKSVTQHILLSMCGHLNYFPQASSNHDPQCQEGSEDLQTIPITMVSAYHLHWACISSLSQILKITCIHLPKMYHASTRSISLMHNNTPPNKQGVSNLCRGMIPNSIIRTNACLNMHPCTHACISSNRGH